MHRERKKWWLPVLTVLGILLLAAAVGIAVVWRMNVYALDFGLLGKSEIVLEYGSRFEDPGAEASFSGSLLLRDAQEVPVQITGSVDTGKVGTYELVYRAEVTYLDLFWQRTEARELKRTVRVVDTQAPHITLTHVEGQYTLPGHEYEEEGFQAVDGYDGDLSDQVVVSVFSDHVLYTVTDSSGNRAEISRVIHFDDPIPPVLTLNGESEITLTEGDAFEDPGCTAQDNCDGDLTGNISVSGAVDTAVPGTYTLTYTVSDAYGNTATATRTVTVEEKPAPPPTQPEIPDEPLPPNGRVIYLTFDDGPDGRHTGRLLNVLKKYNVKATFFVVGTAYLDLLPRIAEEGHAIGMHCNSHTFSSVYASDEAYLEDLQAIQNKIFELTGQTSTILRFPGGSSNTVSMNYCTGIMSRMTAKVEEMGLRYFDWNVDSRDTGGAETSEEVFYNVIAGIRGQQYSVVLQHDIKGFSVDAVERIIQWGLANGYTFATLGPDSPSCEQTVAN